MKIRKWIHPALFTLGGALAGLAYYYFIGCASGSCPITSSPFGSLLYMGVIGYLVSGIFTNGYHHRFRSHWRERQRYDSSSRVMYMR